MSSECSCQAFVTLQAQLGTHKAGRATSAPPQHAMPPGVLPVSGNRSTRRSPAPAHGALQGGMGPRQQLGTPLQSGLAVGSVQYQGAPAGWLDAALSQTQAPKPHAHAADGRDAGRTVLRHSPAIEPGRRRGSAPRSGVVDARVGESDARLAQRPVVLSPLPICRVLVITRDAKVRHARARPGSGARNGRVGPSRHGRCRVRPEPSAPRRPRCGCRR